MEPSAQLADAPTVTPTPALAEPPQNAPDHAGELHAAKRAAADRIVDHLRAGTGDWAPTALINDAAVYTDPERHAIERRKLFRETPNVVCLSSDLPEPGSFRAYDETGVPIVVVRGRDGVVRAFLNSCVHRGARLVREAEGKAKLLTCWFHAWSYTPEGKLAAVPQRFGFEGCLDDRHLVEVPAAERHGLVFVQATPGSTMDIDRHLGEFGPQLAMLDLGDMVRVKSGVLPVASNWKYALDTYGEGYHFASLHRDTIAPGFHADVQVYDSYGPHHKLLLCARPMEAWTDQPRSEWDVDNMVGWIHYLFPNTIIFVGAVTPGRMYTTLFRHYPGETPGETVTYKAIFGPASQVEARRAELEAAYDATAHVVRVEDYVVAAEGWHALSRHPEGRTVLYGRQEIALQNQHRAIAAAIGYKPPHAPELREAAE